MKKFAPVFAALLTLAVSTFAARPYDDWSKFKVLSINTTNTGGGANVSAAVTNFPVLVRLTSGSPTTGSDILAGALSGGADLRFTDELGNVALSYQIERWTAANAEVWVKVPSVAGNATTKIRVYWGKGGSVSASNGPAVFDTANGFRAVWHMNEATSANLTDATGLGNTAVVTGSGSMSDINTGLGIGKTFASAATGYKANNNSNLQMNLATGPYTLSGWVRVSTCDFSATYRPTILAKMDGSGNGEYALMARGDFAEPNALPTPVATNSDAWQIRLNNGSTQYNGFHVGACAANTWQYISATYSGPTNALSNLTSYLNGSSTATTYVTGTGTTRTTDSVTIGKVGNDATAFRVVGSIDEVIISKAARAPSWHKLVYETQKPSPTALSQGTTQDQSTPPSVIAYANPTASYGGGLPITPNTISNTGGAAIFTVSPALPAGLALNTTTGEITGTPTQVSAAANYEVIATNFLGSDTAVVNIEVLLTAPTSLNYSAQTPSYIVGTSITANTPTVNAVIDTFSVSPALPAGLSLNSSTGVITGTATDTASLRDYVITAGNTQGEARDTVSIRVLSAALTNLAYTTPVTYYVGVAASNAAVLTSAAGLALADSFAITPALPGSLTFNKQTGLISGTPSGASAAANYTVTAYNGRGNAVRVVNITLLGAPTALTYASSSPTYAGGVPIAENLPTVTGIVQTWSVSPDLPSGLTLDTLTGIISGTAPTSASNGVFVVSATNPAGSATANLNITVTEAEDYSTWANTKTFNLNTTSAAANTGDAVSQFPVLVRLTSAHAAVFAGSQLTGADIRFSLPDGTRLPYQIERWDSAGLAAEIWVDVGAVSAGTIKPVRIHWGNPDATNKSNGLAVFRKSNGYEAVFHMSSGGTGNETDASRNAFTATAVGGPTNNNTGAIGRARSFPSNPTTRTNNASQYFRITNSGISVLSFPEKSKYTLSAWTNATSLGNQAIIAKTDNQYGMQLNASNAIEGVEFENQVGWRFVGGVAPSTATWYHQSFVRNGTAESLYVNGTLVASAPGFSASGLSRTDSVDVGIGARIAPGGVTTRGWIGSIDEVRLSSMARTAAWQKLEYKTQKPNVTPLFDLSYANGSPSYQENSSIGAANTATVLGTATRYTASGLPTGLAINASTGAITGTPAGPGVYPVTVTAYGDSAWSKTAALSITVTAAIPTGLAYSTPSPVYRAGDAIVHNNPTVTNTVTSWTLVSPLPSGLSLNPVTGQITGTPVSSSAATDYVIIASNDAGSDSVTVNITVNPEENYASWNNVKSLNLNTTASAAAVAAGQGRFPVLVRLSGAHAAVFTGAEPGGTDIRFSKPDGTHLPYQLESWSFTGGDTSAAFWVLLDTVSANATTPVRIHYGKSGALDDSRPSAVFDTANGYVGVWHLNGSGNANDATLNGFTGTNNGTTTAAGATGSGRAFNGSTQYLSVANNSKFDITQNLTVSAWVNSTNWNGGARRILQRGATQYSLRDDSVDSLKLETSAGDVVLVTAPSLNAWHNVVTTYGGGSARIYIDGVLRKSAAAVANLTTGATTELAIGRVPGSNGTGNFQGSMDELRLQKSLRDSNWVKLEYKNQKLGVYPVFDLSYTSAAPTYTQNQSISANTASVAGAATRFEVSPSLPAGLNFNAATGEITGAPLNVSAPQAYTVTAYGDSSWSTTATLNIGVNAAAPSNLSYAADTLVLLSNVLITPDSATVTGVVDSFTVSPALPTGLLLNASNGTITGTPTVASSAANYTVTAHNAIGTTTTDVNITVLPAAPSGLAYLVNPATYSVGTMITANTAGVTGVVDSFTVAPALPAGLSLNASTGAITGTPSLVAASAEYVVTAHNVAGTTNDTLAITVNPAAPSGLSYLVNPATYVVGIAIDTNKATVTGVVDSFTVAPALPAGLSLNASTGAITGAPSITAVQADYVITAHNVTGIATNTLSLRVNPAAPSSLSYLLSPALYVTGITIDTNKATVTGVVDSFTVAPALPSGLSLNASTGAITGTPSLAAASAEYVVTAHNVTGTAKDTVTITVNPGAPSGLAYLVNPATYSVGTMITANTASVIGVVDNFSVSPSLPSGLSFNTSTGTISGTPSMVAGSASYTVVAHNVGGTDTAVVTITVNPAAPTALSYSVDPATYVVGNVITANTPSVTGTVTHWAISPALSSGLGFDTTTGIISGTPSISAALVNYVVTASNVTGSVKDTVAITVNPAAPTALSYSVDPATYVVGASITTNAPSVTGTVTAWSINPGLPAGLLFSGSTGQITGTPSVASSATDYEVTASNVTGSVKDTVSITVLNAPPVISYTTPNTYLVDSVITTLNVSSTGGPVTSYTLLDPLPSGLALNGSTGAISGTPADSSAATAYRILATGPGGLDTATITITVNSGIQVPGVPTLVLGTAGNTQVSVAFTAPVSDGGAAITSYTVTSNPGGFTGTGAASPITVNGLVNGTAYTFTVTATNSAGPGAASVPSAPVTPATVPGAPTIGTATAGNASASVTFTAPVSNGGSAITTYTVTSTPGGFTGTGAASPVTVNGLVNGTAYTFTVTATNVAGPGAASAASNSVTPATVPGAPTIGTATAGNASASVAFTAPASNGGSAITGYTVTSNPGGFTGTGAASPITVNGLVNGTAYTFTVTATNVTGPGAASAASNSVTPATVPGAPTIGTATAGNASASVAFTAPASNGGSAITTYTVTSNPGGFTGTGAASPITVNGLVNGTAYTFTVTATNVAGPGAASAASNSVTPATVPGAPTIGTATAGNVSASVTFTAPVSNGGSAITGYTVTSNPGGFTGTGAASPITVNGLVNGTAYTFTVTATNATGPGTASAASNSVTPRTVPGAPTIGTATAGNTSASVTFTAPVSNGGSVITGYTVTSTPGGFTGTGATSPVTVNGLVNGTAYTFTVTATNVAGPGAASAASNSVTPATVPGAPTIGTATAGNASASVTFTAPVSNGGSAITGYTVTSNPGGFTGTGAASPITVNGLVNGTAYTFTVTATNATGPGTASAASNSVTPRTVPGAPTIGTATAGNVSASVTFTAPVSNGGSAITGYTVTSNPGSFTGTGAASPITVNGLVNGTAYTFTVTATNVAGPGAASAASNSVTPATVPGAPTIGTATAGNASASVTFTAPVSNGGSVITIYTVTSNPGGFTGTGATSPVTVNGLVNGTAYTFTVTATNVTGPGTASAASNSVTPATVPGAPTIGTATAGNTSASVTFTAPVSNGGSAITIYTVTSNPGGFTGTGAASPITVNGLVNGTAYTFTVTATNGVGPGAASAASNSVTPATVPGAPTIGTATAGNASASVTFTAPASNGGSAITTYTVTSNPGGFTGTGATSPVTVNGLVNGTAYTFTVTATNVTGPGTASAASNSVTPRTVPGAPTIGTATAGNVSASVTFTAPASNGGSAITTYTVTSNPGGFTGTGAASPVTVNGLVNGTAYTFTVTATNVAGPGTASAASNSVTPATVPGAPTIGTATAGNASASVTFTAPASNGGSAITTYTVTSTPGGFTGTGATSPVTVNGLVNGTAYTFTVTATNVTGPGTASVASNSVTPATVPGAPTIGTATAGNASASVTFTAPVSNGGSVITGYTVTSTPGGFTGTGATSPVTVNGLVNGTAYTFTVTATNGVGPGAASAASNSVTPRTVAGAPTIGTATAGNASASVTFTAPASNGGSAITGYTVTSTPGGFTGTGATSPITVNGLVNGTAYTFTVTATNGAGPGAASAASNSVTPNAPPVIAYAGPQIYTVGNLITTLAVSSTGGPVASYAISPNLTANTGLAFSTSNGAISGTPTTAQALAVYTVIATGPGGADTATITITVEPATGILPDAFVIRVNGAAKPYAFQLPAGVATEKLTLSINDAFGRTVWSKTVNPVSDRISEIAWDGKKANGMQASAGMYVVRISVLNGGKVTQYVKKSVSLKPR